MRTTAKICGVTTMDALDASVGGGASHLGFVSFPPSPRHLDTERIAALVQRLPAAVEPVAVLVDPDDALLAHVALTGVTIFQLHRTAPDRIAAIRARHRQSLWAAVAVRRAPDLMPARDLVGLVDRVVYDAQTPSGAALPGGMGIRFDWGLLDGFRHPLPWVLSGGLAPDNVGDAIARTRAPIVDISSGVEGAPGVKDPGRIAAFLDAVAAA